MPLVKIEQLEEIIGKLSDEFWDEVLAEQILHSLSDEETALNILTAIYEELKDKPLIEPIFGDTNAV